LAPGVVIAGRYVVERQLAEGGIGVVVVARHHALHQRVAIKYLQAKPLESPAIVERFKREAQLAACIRSEHVVRVFDIGMLPDGGPYIVMEYLEGEDLGAIVERGALPVPLAVDYVLQACEALAEAHALGIVHRDLKPQNLFLATRGAGPAIVKILDFGISKASSRGDLATRLPRMTEVGERFGTPVYMSPEQLVSSADVDPRADIWALGVVLFELLTADLPFEGETVPQIAANILGAAPTPLRARCPHGPAALEAVLLKCLEKDRERRYRNVAELAQDLVDLGVAASAERVATIARIVREGGESIRPPSLRELPSEIVAPPPRSTQRHLQATLDAFAAPPEPPRSRRSTRLAIFGAAAVATALAVGGGARLAMTSQVPSGLVAQNAAAPPAETKLQTALVMTAALAETPAPSASPAATAAVAVPRIERHRVETKVEARAVTTPAPVRSEAPAPTPAPPPPSPSPSPAPARAPNADYMEFGERR
jgi:serine/threonine-protein kinase